MKWVASLALLLLPLAARAQAPSGQFPPEPAAPAAAQPAATSPPGSAPPVEASAPSVPPQTAVPAVPSQPTAPAVPPRLVPPPAPPAPPKAPPANWNIGAGLLVGGGDPIALLGGTSRPSYQAAFERRLGMSTWLALSGRFSYDSWDYPVQSSSDQPSDRLEVGVNRTAFALLLGLRHAFVQKVVEVSVFSAVFAGYEDVGGDELRPGESISAFPQQGDSERGLGLLGGVAVERELIEALALRLSIDMAAASLSRRQSVNRDGDGTVTETDLGERRFVLSVRPGLQIHFYF